MIMKWPRPCVFFLGGGSIDKGGHVPSFKGGHWHDRRVGVAGRGGVGNTMNCPQKVCEREGNHIKEQ